MIEIRQYTSFFHDGSIMQIDHVKNMMTITMESAEISEEDMDSRCPLTKNNRIRGHLHLEEITSILKDNAICAKKLIMQSNDATIFYLQIDENRVVFEIIWQCYPNNFEKEEFSTIEIEAGRIWWEYVLD